MAAAKSMAAAKTSDWTILFDGDSVEHWRAFRGSEFPDGGWEVREGILTALGDGDRIDIITREKFQNFELELEWRVEPSGNSGLFYRVSEEPDWMWNFAPEVQILDDSPETDPAHGAGALYALLPPNNNKHLRPVGEFNQVRLIVRGNEVEHWLNGEKVLSYNLNDADLKEKIAGSKFGKFEKFAQIERGHIGLQHHGDTVGFRNIRIRELPASTEN